MTLEQFLQRFNLKHKRTVMGWLEQELIPGAIYDKEKDSWFIPDRALPPYTQARAKNVPSIYQSIVRGCIKRRYVSAKLYNISEQDFMVYTQQLHKAGVIEIVWDNDIPYYYETLESEAFANTKNPMKYLKLVLKVAGEAVVGAAATAMIKRLIP